MSLLEKKVQTIWLITFGDLLTLLLCFFVAVITLSQAGVASFSQAIASQSSKPAELGKKADKSRHQLTEQNAGTVVATTTPKDDLQIAEISHGTQRLVEISLSRGWVLGGSSESLRRLREAITPYFDGRFARAIGADIEVCRNVDGESEGTAWLKAGNLALQLTRQLIDLGFSAKSVRARNLGSMCGALGPGARGGTNGNPVAEGRLTLIFEK